MRITRLTPDQARALSEQLACTTALLRRVLDGIREMARQVTETFRSITAHLRQAGVIPPANRGLRWPNDRPAWASPYGPDPKGHR
ncbi:hypothetical protein AQJ11_02840 [Streptomyces corchorusii]|uniref:Uncharacterized protein n=2 Tax=Streptomyces TaxID=1883 RepID=A0A101QM50_STRCK|nr:hypothetical protein [Streptomyces corchorusii]KUN32478.1 hypothetical protein AQJ11_02840 [Streptomyces corchorusii]